MIALSGYRAFFDRSADHDKDEMGGTVVAGFISTIEQWALWEAEWHAVLEEFEVPYFHMKEIKRRKGAYADKKWEEASHREFFLEQLAGTVNKWAMASIGNYMEHQIYEDANKVCVADKTFNPFAECSRNCVLQAQAFVRDELQSTLPVDYVFEKGDEGKGLLIELMNRCNLPKPNFKRPRFDPGNRELDINDPPLIQLQASDLLAWEIRRWKIEHKLGLPMRRSTRILASVKKRIWKECTYQDMARVLKSAEVPRRLT